MKIALIFLSIFLLNACVSQVLNLDQARFQNDYKSCFGINDYETLERALESTHINNKTHVATLEKWQKAENMRWRNKGVIQFVLNHRYNHDLLNQFRTRDARCDADSTVVYDTLQTSYQFSDKELTIKYGDACYKMKESFLEADLYDRESLIRSYKDVSTAELENLYKALEYSDFYEAEREKIIHDIRFKCLKKIYSSEEIHKRMGDWIKFWSGDAPSPKMDSYDAKLYK